MGKPHPCPHLAGIIDILVEELAAQILAGGQPEALAQTPSTANPPADFQPAGAP